MSFIGQRLASPLVATTLISVLVWLTVIGLRSTGTLESLELAAYDWCLGLRLGPPEPDPRIVLIQISEHDIRVQQRWPLTDKMLVEVRERLAQAQPRAIGLPLHLGHHQYSVQ
jgi:adenylate cyclase